MPNVALPQADVNTAVFSVLDAFPYPATIVDPTGRIVSINTLFALRFGLTVSECIGQDIFVLASTNLNPERLTFRREAGEDVLRTGKAFVF
ncbi:MAG: PAS domain-containing protein [Chlorobiales bacterium]|nr:PAS domain-containing protein [Chlorobiales bacterium]